MNGGETVSGLMFDYTQLHETEVKEILTGITEDGYFGRWMSTNQAQEAMLLLLREVRLIRTQLEDIQR